MALKFINSLITQKPLDVKSWNLNTVWLFLCKPSWAAPGHVTKILQAESGQKVDELEPIYLGKYRYWWKMVCDFWARYQSPFFWLCSCTPIWIQFFLFCIFFLTFLFLLSLFVFKPLNALYSKFEGLQMSGRIFVCQKLDVPGWSIPSIGSSKILNF